MPKVKRLDRAKRKFEARAGAAAGDYVQGVAEDNSWEDATAAAGDNYASGVQKAITQDRFGTGVRAAGQAKYKKGVAEKGRTRYAEGVTGAGDAWEQGFAPYRDAIESTTLPDRGPKGSEANIQRMVENVRAITAAADRIKGSS